MKSLTKTAVRYADTKKKYGAATTLKQTILDLLELQPGEDYIEWFLDGNNVIVRKAVPPEPKKEGE